jgi:signal transduction histidine kinase
VLTRIFVGSGAATARAAPVLGLYIVKGLVEAHGGRIEVTNGEGGGAVFRFVLPAGTPEAFLED